MEPPHLLLTQASSELRLATASVQTIVYLCHRQSSLSQLHLSFFFRLQSFFLTQWPPDRLPKPPVSLSAGLEQAKKLKDPSPSQRRLLTRLRWKALASWQIMPCSAQAPPTNFNESRNASGKKLEKSPCIQVHATPGQPPWVGLAVAMSAFPWCEARSILAHRSHDVINPVWTPVKNRTMWLKRLGWVKNTSSLWLKEVPYS